MQEEQETKGELLTVQATADLFKVHIQTVQYWKRQGLIVVHKMGHRTYFKKAEVMEPEILLGEQVIRLSALPAALSPA